MRPADTKRRQDTEDHPENTDRRQRGDNEEITGTLWPKCFPPSTGGVHRGFRRPAKRLPPIELAGFREDTVAMPGWCFGHADGSCETGDDGDS